LHRRNEVSRCVHVVADRSPTLRRRELASQLRDLRKQSGRTVEDVARELLCSPPKISRIETGVRPASLRDVRDLCIIYGVDDSLRDRLMTLAREAKQQGWWNRYEDLAIESLIGLEIEAAQISSYESCVIPWMFQTREYARAVIRGILPRIGDHVLDERVTARITRQELITRESPPHFWSLVDESALRRRVGSNDIMRDQLKRMVELATIPNITLQVVPFSLGAHPGLDNTFELLEFQSAQSPVVYIDNMAGALYVERAADVDRFKEALMHLRAGALDPESSISLIERVRETFDA
jgi:transcriptional regulator with XRE-family HTH domain